jgi:hypothetical protein
MSDLFIDELFNPPKLDTGDRIVRKDTGILSRKRGTVVSSGGWFAVIRWDGNPQPRREFIPDLEGEDW